MGIGQSKFRRESHQTQYPYGAPGYLPPYSAPQQPFIPGYGPGGFSQPGQAMYPQQQPQGFIPPGPYGQGAFLPPPQLNWLPQDKRRKRKSRRTQSERFPGGFAPGMAQQQAQRRHTSSESRRRGDAAPVFPQASTAAHPREQGPSRRAPTPFIPPYGRDEDDEEEDEDRPRVTSADLRRESSRQSHVRYAPPPPIDAAIEHVLQPMEPASTAAFGPTGPRPVTPLRNPLPPPPRDLYEMTPYKSLLTLPQTTALLTATYGPQQLSNTALAMQPSVKRKKSVKGLFRAFSKRDKNKEPEQPRVQFIPVFVAPKDQQQPISRTHSRSQSDTLHRSMSQHSRRPPSLALGPNNVTPQHTGHLPTGTSGLATGGTYFSPNSPRSSTSSEDSIQPVPPIPSSPPAVRFNQETFEYNSFLNHSPHRVLFRNQIYPTAMHLYEALKFIDHRPDIAEAIRNCNDVSDVYPLAAKYQDLQRTDWPSLHVDMMEEVLLIKFKQHPDLRIKLLGTREAERIIYTEPDDYWGIGFNGQGQNMFGRALVRVREKLRTEAL
ncbi:hypothetical protein GALMADRAFT_236867 [Galerina marginata CBS 339.88]|uniref:NADAR domain-containing protein n=1 Tax=Galerina marginata (strain CBS 339.88) TaxID=685588 RepID=A0A067TW53_GALM3|nr:hypothetical protein GALMADRAFT_236867 [Galerina marginata CBS 339.88]